MKRPVLLTAALLAACAGSSPSGLSTRAPATSTSDERPLAELPQQELAEGQCGMVLWQRTEPARRIAYILDTPPSARIMEGGKVVALARTGAEGDRVARHAPLQRFAGAGHALVIDVQIEQREGLGAGAIIPDGTLTWQWSGGSVVLPVFGLIGCR